MKRAFLVIALLIAAGFLATGAGAQDTAYTRGDDPQRRPAPPPPNDSQAGAPVAAGNRRRGCSPYPAPRRRWPGSRPLSSALWPKRLVSLLNGSLSTSWDASSPNSRVLPFRLG